MFATPAPPRKNKKDNRVIDPLNASQKANSLEDSTLDSSSKTIVNEIILSKESLTSTHENESSVNKGATPSSKETAIFPSCNYIEPSWSSLPKYNFIFEIIKNGVIIENIVLHNSNKTFFTFGRIPNCDYVLEHPSISRFHAVLQYRDNGGLYLYDLGSTHGTRLNKQHIAPHMYYRLRSGYVVTFGLSTRIFVLHAPEDVQIQDEEELELLRKKQVLHNNERDDEEEQANSCLWGFREDATEEEFFQHEESDSKLTDNRKSKKWEKDPKKALISYFESENLDVNYIFEEGGTRRDKTFICRINLPVHVEGEQLVAVGEAKRKKDAIFNASYDACRLLSRRGMLSSGGRRAKETVAAGWGGPGDEDDDNDDYLDRTGDVERKRARREGTKSAAREIHTKENLLEKIKKLREEQKRLVDKLIALPTVITAEDAEDELEKYMSRIKNSVNANKRKAIQKELEAICLKVAEAESFLQLIRPVKRNYMSVAYQLQNELTPHNNNNNNSSSGNKSNNRNNEIDINSSIDSNESNIMSVIESNTTSNSGSYKANGSEETTKLEATKSGENKKDKKKKTSKRVFVEEQVSTWMPPADQKGDGKTHLNEKYGY